MSDKFSFGVKVAAGVAALFAVSITFRCAVGDSRFGRCMQDAASGGISYLLYVGSWLLAAWLGVEAAKSAKRPWVGWVVGIALVFAFGFMLGWLGFEAPRGSGEDEDFNYRR